MAKSRSDCPTPTLVGVGFDLLAIKRESRYHRHRVGGEPCSIATLKRDKDSEWCNRTEGLAVVRNYFRVATLVPFAKIPTPSNALGVPPGT